MQAPKIVDGEGPPAPRLSLRWSCSVDQGIWKDLKEIGLQLHGFGAVNGSISGKKRLELHVGKKVSGVFTLIFIYIYKVNNGQFRLMPKRCFEDTTMIRTNFA